MPLLEAALGAAAFVLASWVWTQLALRALALSPGIPHWRVVCAALSNIFFVASEPSDYDYFSGIVQPKTSTRAGKATQWEPDGEPRPATFANGRPGKLKECLLLVIDICAWTWQTLAACLRWADVTLLQPLEQSMAMLQASSQDATDESFRAASRLGAPLQKAPQVSEIQGASETADQSIGDPSKISSREQSVSNGDAESDCEKNESPTPENNEIFVQSEKLASEALAADQVQSDSHDVSKSEADHVAAMIALARSPDVEGVVALDTPLQGSPSTTDLTCVDEKTSVDWSSQAVTEVESELEAEEPVATTSKLERPSVRVEAADITECVPPARSALEKSSDLDRSFPHVKDLPVKSAYTDGFAKAELASQKGKRTSKGGQSDTRKPVVVLCRGDKVIEAGSLDISGSSYSSEPKTVNVVPPEETSQASRSESSHSAKAQDQWQTDSIAETLLQKRTESHEAPRAILMEKSASVSSSVALKAPQPSTPEGRSSNKIRASATWKPSLRFSGGTASSASSNANNENPSIETSSKSKASRTNAVRRSFYAVKEIGQDE